jgi:predicted DNA-binding ribbon-helix-helix protein
MTKTIPPTIPVSNGREGEHRASHSFVIKRSIIRDGHKSSVSLEDEFWDGLREIADRERVTVSTLVATIDHGSNKRNLSSAIRVFVLDHFRRKGEKRLSTAPADTQAPAARTTPPQVS